MPHALIFENMDENFLLNVYSKALPFSHLWSHGWKHNFNWSISTILVVIIFACLPFILTIFQYNNLSTL